MSDSGRRAIIEGLGSFRAARIVLTLFVVAAVLLLAPSARASNFSGASSVTGCNGVNMQDNSTMTYYRSALTTKMYNAVADTLNNDVLPTDVSLSPELAGHTDIADVVYYDADYNSLCGYDWHPDDSGDPDSNWIGGLYECISLAGVRCEHSHVYFDTSAMDPLNSDAATTWACHETGHTLGLTHRDEGGCMPAIVPANAHFFTTHDKSHINTAY